MGSFGAHMASQVEDYKQLVAAKDAEIAKLRAEVEALRSDRDDVIRRNAQLAGDTVPLDEAIAHLASYCHARGYADDCAAMQQPGSRSKFAATLWRVLGNAHADRRFLLSELDAARAALDGEREACDEARRLVGIPNPFDPKWNDDMRAWCDRYSARRAAEAQPTRGTPTIDALIRTLPGDTAEAQPKEGA